MYESVKGQTAFDEEYPVLWVRVLEHMHKSGEEVVRGAQALQMARQVEGGLEEDTVRAMLAQFHRVGEVIYFDRLTPLFAENIVVLRPLWVATMFREILTRKTGGDGALTGALAPEEEAVPPALALRVTPDAWRALWRLFLEEGMLSQLLLEHYLWAGKGAAMVEITLLLMERLDLLLPLQQGGAKSRGFILVPSAPLNYWAPGVGTLKAEESDVLLKLSCEMGHLPGGFFSRLLLQGLRSRVWGTPVLRYSYAELCPYDLQPLKVCTRIHVCARTA
jgi:hypothetical protein